jgi:hypothetical protein
MAINGSEWKLEAKTKTCDFERALINAMNEQFPEKETPSVGCLFHFKQAIRRKLLQFKVPSTLISELINKDGLVNILPIAKPSELKTKVNLLYITYIYYINYFVLFYFILFYFILF